MLAQPGKLFPGLRAVGRAKQRCVFDSGENGVGIRERWFEVPDASEFPWMWRAVIPLMRAGNAFVLEFVSNGSPGVASVVRALNQLAEPAGRLRYVEAIGIRGRSLEVINLPTAEMRPIDVPPLALSIGSKNECAFARSHKHSYAAHV